MGYRGGGAHIAKREIFIIEILPPERANTESRLGGSTQIGCRYKDASAQDGATRIMESIQATGYSNSIGDGRILMGTVNDGGTVDRAEITKAAALAAYGRAAASTKPNVLSDMAAVLYDEF